MEEGKVKTSELVEYYQFDDEGYYIGPVSVQIVNGEPLLPPNVTPTPPPQPQDASEEDVSFNWNGESWSVEVDPTTCEEFVGVVIDHYSDTPHDIKLREKLQKTLEKGGSDYREGRGEDLSWYVEVVTEEEKAANEANAALSDFDSQLSSIKPRMELANLMNDTEQMEALRGEYRTLMGLDAQPAD